MLDKTKTWLEDIRLSIEEIKQFIPQEMTYEDFKSDLKTRKAVERNLEIIGEAMDRVLNANASIAISDSRKIVDTRNRIIHGYESVSPDIIWTIVEQYLPTLNKEVTELLNQ